MLVKGATGDKPKQRLTLICKTVWRHWATVSLKLPSKYIPALSFAQGTPTQIVGWYLMSSNQIIFRAFVCVYRYKKDALYHTDVTWRQWSGSTLVQVIAYFLTAPCYCLDQCSFIISGVLWHSCRSSQEILDVSVFYAYFQITHQIVDGCAGESIQLAGSVLFIYLWRRDLGVMLLWSGTPYTKII